MAPDDGSKNPEPEGTPGDPDMDRIEDRLDGVHEYVEALEERVDDLSEMVVSLTAELEEEREQRRQATQEYAQRIAELEKRTDMLRLVENADQADGAQRSKALLQHLKREAESRERAGDEPLAAVDRDAAERALQYPDVDRTTIYDDMRRVVRLVDDEQVCWYGDGELRLDMTGDGTAQQLLGICGASTTGETGARGVQPTPDGGRVKQDTH